MRHRWMIFYASVIHICWGIGALLSDKVASNSFLHEIAKHGNDIFTGTVLVLAGLVALAAVKLHSTRPFLALGLAIPQQVLLILSAIGFLDFFISGSVPEVGEIQRGSIFPAVVVAVSGAVCHTLALWDNYSKGMFKWTT